MMLARASETRCRWPPLSLARRGVVRHLAGHSKWANIRKKKGGLDAARGDLFAKLSRNVEVASRLAKGDRSHITLSSAISRAKQQRLPKKTLEAAVDRGAAAGGGGGDVQHLTYEGTLGGGVGVIVDALTDNKNRTANDVRSIFKKHGGALAAQNSVAWAWRRVGELRVERAAAAGGAAAPLDAAAHEVLFEAALEGGADDVDDLVEGSTEVRVVSEPAATAAVRDALGAAGFAVAMELVWVPDGEVDVPDGDAADAVGQALDALDDHADVAAVFHNARLGDEAG